MLNQRPVRDLPAAFAHEAERLQIVNVAERFLVVEDNNNILSSSPTLFDAKRALAALLIERLDELRRHVVKPLFRMH